MLFETQSLTDSVPQFTASVPNSPKQTTTLAGKPDFFKRRQRSNPAAHLLNSTTVEMPRIMRRPDNKILHEPCIIPAEPIRPRSTDIQISGVLQPRSQNAQTPLCQKSPGLSQKRKVTKATNTELLLEYFSQIVNSQKRQLYGLSVKLLVQLYIARCQDLQIRVSKSQLIRFAEIFERGNNKRTQRILNLSDMGLGDLSMAVVCKIIEQSNGAFSRLDLSKNLFKDEGLRLMSQMLMRNTSIFHLDISDNLITAQGATMLFQTLKNHQYITSIEMANRDSQKSRVKIGNKGAYALRQMLQQPLCLMSHLDLTSNTLPPDALGFIIEGVNSCRSLVNLNLSSNGLGQNDLTSLLSIFDHNQSLVDINLSNNGLQDQFIEQMAPLLRDCLPLQKLNLSCNKLSIKGAASLLHGLQEGANSKVMSLILDKNDFRTESHSDLPHLIWTFNRTLKNCLGKLRSISLGSCQLDRSTVRAIGEGIKVNQSLEFLNLRDNMIYIADLQAMTESLIANPAVPLKHLDLSCNQLRDKSGAILYRGLKEVTALETLNLRDNQLEQESEQQLVNLVKENRSICKMVLDYNLINAGAIHQIEEQCKTNESKRIFRDVPLIQNQIRCFKKVHDDFKKIDDLTTEQVVNKEQMQQLLSSVHRLEDLIDGLKKEQESKNQMLRQELDSNAQTLLALDGELKTLNNLALVKKMEQGLALQARQQMVKLQEQKTVKAQADLDREIRLTKFQHVHDLKSERSWYQDQFKQVTEKNKQIDRVNQEYTDEIRKAKEEINALLRLEADEKRKKVVVFSDSPDKTMEYSVGVGGSPSKRLSPAKLKGGSPTKRKLNRDLKLKKVRLAK